ncbi:SDR family oxidoreductase [Paracoccus sp. (in: a-proteobacteria)]|uniref:SDR family oxidoreductase n=1 Tax=Paracoccus sp. TaxID=267 RepID=UPI00396CDA36
MTEQHDGMIAVVTGASCGLGRALAACLAARGLHVVGVARNEVQLAETAKACAPGRFTGMVGDVSQPALMRDIAGKIEDRIGPPTILINNAAIFLKREFTGMLAEDIVEHVQINCCGQINATAALLPAMLKQGRGRIINVGSFAGDAPVPGQMGYAVSKAGARAFSRALTVDLARHLPAVTVSEWIPGILATRTGVAHGIPPSKAAPWGAALALDFRPELHGATFLKNREMIPDRSLRQRVKDALLLKAPKQPHLLTLRPLPSGARETT